MYLEAIESIIRQIGGVFKNVKNPVAAQEQDLVFFTFWHYGNGRFGDDGILHGIGRVAAEESHPVTFELEIAKSAG